MATARGGACQSRETLGGEYFRSVELSYGHPDDVVSGEGARLYGGRFVKPGVRAVFGSADELTAVHEVTARRRRLVGRLETRLADYPRITYVIAIRLAIGIDLTLMDSEVDALLPACPIAS
jgi:RES domain-containing protein